MNADLEAAGAFLDQYAEHPPRADAHRPAADSPKWRAIQTQLHDVAQRLRLAAGSGGGVEFLETDAQFLETQASRLWRMHHWIERGPMSPENQAAFDSSRLAAERLEVLAAVVRGLVRTIGER